MSNVPEVVAAGEEGAEVVVVEVEEEQKPVVQEIAFLEEAEEASSVSFVHD